MKDLDLNSLFFMATTLGILAAILFILYIKLLSKQYFALKNSYLPLTQKDLPFYYSSYAIRQEGFRKFFHLKPKMESVLTHAAIKNIHLAAPLIYRQIAAGHSRTYLVLLGAEIALLLNNRTQFQNILESFSHSGFFFPKPLHAKYLYLSALNNLYLTDMLTASKQCSSALKIYQKLGYIYEEAECYQALAQIYRISGIHDVAFTMLKEAEKIYHKLNLNAKIAETQAYLGLNEIGRENFDAAREYLQEALNIADKQNFLNLRTSIYNWLGLICYLNKDLPKAKHYFQAVSSCPQTAECEAYATEMLARIHFQKKNYAKAFAFAQRALLIYQDINDPAGIFENQYLQAEILYAEKKYSQSETILTRLIRRKSSPNATFYPANAYTLLGLINLKKGNFSIAETLFKQAADLEHGKNRLKGAAIDYNNLAEVAKHRGQQQEAEKYIKQAISYAESINDKELVAYLSFKLK